MEIERAALENEGGDEPEVDTEDTLKTIASNITAEPEG